jgi:hypothetical protein
MSSVCKKNNHVFDLLAVDALLVKYQGKPKRLGYFSYAPFWNYWQNPSAENKISGFRACLCINGPFPLNAICDFAHDFHRQRVSSAEDLFSITLSQRLVGFVVPPTSIFGATYFKLYFFQTGLLGNGGKEPTRPAWFTRNRW